ncbi:MAG: hypothetical protein CL878_08090, partial [Dehalococcoidia bacterium]|nr:hypothetical protein [Dehalococcoidia bacterium]
MSSPPSIAPSTPRGSVVPSSAAPEPAVRTPGRFQWLVIATVAATYLLIVMGGVVRVTGSGLGCPDWPLCHGRLFPPLEFTALIEYTHRLMGAVVSALIVAVVGGIWLRFRHHRMLVALASGVVVLLVIQIILGAVTVFTELSPSVVLIHLGLAMLVLGTLVVLAVFTGRSGATLTANNRQEVSQWLELRTLVLATAAAVYGLVLTGAAVRATGATWSCVGWPDCNGVLLPLGVDQLVDTHLLHRFTAYTIAALAIFTVIRARPWRRMFPDVWWWSLTLVAGVVAQGAIGVWGVTAGFVPLAQALHVAGASAVWTAAVALAALVARRRLHLPEPITADDSPPPVLTGVDSQAGASVTVPPSPEAETAHASASERHPYEAAPTRADEPPAASAPPGAGRRPLAAFVQLTKPRIILLLLAPTLCAMI